MSFLQFPPIVSSWRMMVTRMGCEPPCERASQPPKIWRELQILLLPWKRRKQLLASELEQLVFEATLELVDHPGYTLFLALLVTPCMEFKVKSMDFVYDNNEWIVLSNGIDLAIRSPSHTSLHPSSICRTNLFALVPGNMLTQHTRRLGPSLSLNIWIPSRNQMPFQEREI